MGKKFDLAGLIAGQEAQSGARASQPGALAYGMSDSDTIRRLPVEEIHDNSGNFYSVEDVKDLTDSISVSGVLQPILVRPRPEGGYLLIAGHRRTKAVRILRDEWKGKGENPWDTIPALVRPAPSTRAEELLEELALIQTNAAVRKLSDAEISAQAEKLTDILADLKREGYDFPGRMRKLVADALGVSETKLAKQKLIREKLSPGWLERWKAGNVAEYTAEVLTKYSPELQEALLFKKKLDPYTARSLAEYYAKCVAKRTCKVSHDVTCDWGDHFWAVGSRIENEWNRCVGYGESCCKDCKKALKCGQCCPKALEAAKKAKKRKEDESKREQARRDREAAQRKATADLLWARFKQLREAAGLSVKQVEDGIMKACGWTVNLKPLEERRDLYSWETDRTPEEKLNFKGAYGAAKILGVPVEALTDVKWKPEAAGDGGGLETPGDGEAAARALPQSLRDSSLPERAGTAAGTEDGSAPHQSPAATASPGGSQGDGVAEPYWRPFPKVKPPKGQRAMVVQHDSDYERLLFEAKLAEWNGEAWHWVSELIPDVEAERVELWLPEPAYPAETEDDDAEEDV